MVVLGIHKEGPQSKHGDAQYDDARNVDQEDVEVGAMCGGSGTIDCEPSQYASSHRPVRPLRATREGKIDGQRYHHKVPAERCPKRAKYETSKANHFGILSIFEERREHESIPDAPRVEGTEAGPHDPLERKSARGYQEPTAEKLEPPFILCLHASLVFGILISRQHPTRFDDAGTDVPGE